MNSILITGNLTRDPELRQTPSGTPVCNMTVACGRTYQDKDGTYKTDYFKVTCWRGLAEACARNLTKGSKVGVSGTMQIDEYQASDGTKRTAHTVMASEVEFLYIKRHENETTEPYAQPIDNEELPF